MLGSLTEADDAVQEAWIRLSRTDTSDVENLRGWLTTVVGRVCLNMLRSRRTRREAPLETHVSDPLVSPEAGVDPEQEAILGDSLGLALLAVLDAPEPRRARRVRAARRVRRTVRRDRPDRRPVVGRRATAREPGPPARPGSAGARHGPRRPMGGRRRVPRRGTRGRLRAAAGRARSGCRAPLRRRRRASRPGLRPPRSGSRRHGRDGLPALRRDRDPSTVNGVPGGIAWAPDGSPFAVVSITVAGGRIVSIDILADPDRLSRLDLDLVAG